MNNFCGNCGEKLKEGAKFCPSCGQKVGGESSEQISQSNVQTPPQSPNYDNNQQYQNQMNQTPNYGNNQQYQTPMNQNPNYGNNRQFSNPNSIEGQIYDLFLRHDGRLNRLRFFKRNLLASLVASIAYVILFMAINLVTDDDGLSDTGATIVLCGLLAYLNYGLIVRRCHDLSRNAMAYNIVQKDDQRLAQIFAAFQALKVLMVIASDAVFANIGLDGIIILYLYFAAGEVGDNQYGPDPLAMNRY